MAKNGIASKLGFTLVEVLVGIAVISTLSSAGYFTVVNIRESARENKLEADVTALNTAVQSYLGSGGSIPVNATAEQVITKLKTRATDAVAAQSMGMTGSFIDVRTQPATQSADEAGSSQLRAVWNSAQQRFALERTGAPGIKSLVLNNELAGAAPVQETRTLNVAASDVTSGQPVWVWDVAENVDNTPALGAAPGVGSGAGYTPPTEHQYMQLSPPTISVASRAFTLTQLAGQAGVTAAGNFTVSITNPNPGDISHLTPGSSASVSAIGGSVTAQALSDDPDVWTDSPSVSESYSVTPLALTASVTASRQTPTPFQLGVTPASGVGGSTTATATISNWGSVPTIFQGADKFQLVMAVGSADPSAQSGSAQQQTSVALTTSSGWTFPSGTPTLTLSAMAKTVNPAFFASSPVATTTLTATKPTLALGFAPASGATLNASETIAITASDLTQFPSGYTIKYTTDNSTPSASNGTTYGAPLIPPTAGALVLKAVALPPGGYTNWFNSQVYTASYTVQQTGSLMPVGALVAFTTIQENAQFSGNLIISGTAANNLTFFGSSRVKGNLFVPGTPEIYKDHVASSQYDNQLWSPATDGNFSNYILGKQFDEDGVEVVPATESPSPRVVNLDGNPNPSNYRILIQDTAKIEGKIYRRSTPVTLPTVSAPGNKSNNNTASYHSWSLDPNNPNRLSTTVNPATYANVSLTTAANITLSPGNYGNVSASNNGKYILGNAANPNTVSYYSFDALSLSGGADIEIVGKVVITLKSNMAIHDGAVVGNSAHPEWLQINFYTTAAANANNQQFVSTGTSKFYGQLVAPKGLVTFENGSTFVGSVASYNMQVKSNGVLLSLPPVSTL